MNKENILEEELNPEDEANPWIDTPKVEAALPPKPKTRKQLLKQNSSSDLKASQEINA